jgi:hypothetical protein
MPAYRKTRSHRRFRIVANQSDYNMRRPLDMDELDGEASELCWGSGLTPQDLENAPPAAGGTYKGLQASLDDPPGCNVQVSRDPRV